jgi:hypothetical protein
VTIVLCTGYDCGSRLEGAELTASYDELLRKGDVDDWWQKGQRLIQLVCG